MQKSAEGQLIGVVGTGVMGSGIAQLLAAHGFKILLFDQERARAEAAIANAGEQWKKLAAKGKMTEAAAAEARRRLMAVFDLNALASCHLVVEAIVEDLTVKKQLFRQLESICPPATLLATNTSSFSVTEIQAACKDPARVVGWHFFNPVPLMKVVEVIPGELTSPEAVQTLLQITKATGHTPVVASDTPGFIINHAGRGYGTEALRVVGEGIATFSEVDRIMREVVGFRMGPFELLDLTGLDVSHPVMESIYQQYYHEPRFRPSPLTRRRMAAGLLGKKVGRGFYAYRDGVQVPAEPKTRGGQVKDLGAIAVVGHDETLTSNVTTWLRGWGFDDAGSIVSAQVILCAPLGEDLTTFALRHHLDPTRCIGLDALFQPQRLVTLMRNPATDRQLFENFATTLQNKGVDSILINDSAGFVAQRIFAHVVNVACDMAQSRVGQPEDIDLAVSLGLGYPQGPLTWGNKVGAEAVHEILRNLFKTYEDPRYRASVWLARRAALKLSLQHAD